MGVTPKSPKSVESVKVGVISPEEIQVAFPVILMSGKVAEQVDAIGAPGATQFEEVPVNANPTKVPL